MFAASREYSILDTGSAAFNRFATAPIAWLAPLLFLSGVATSFVVPFLGIFATRTLGASTIEAPLYFAAVATAGLVIVLGVGRLSDFVGSRRSIIAAGFLVVALGDVLLASTGSYAQMVFVGAAFLSWAGVTTSQLFALAKEEIDRANAQAQGSFLTGLLRMCYSLGWAAGPVPGALLIAYTDAPTVFRFAGAICVVAALISLARLPTGRARVRGIDQPPKLRRLVSPRNKRLLIFGVAIVCLLSGDVVRVSLLPLHVTEDLHAPPEALGLIFAVTPLLEVPFLPLAGFLADRYGSRTVLLAGSAAAVVYYAGLAFSTSVWQVYLLQIAYAVAIAAVVGVGINYAQRLGRSETGTAAGVYFSAQNGAVLVGSVLGGITAERYGIGAAFVPPAALCVVGLVLIATLSDVSEVVGVRQKAQAVP